MLKVYVSYVTNFFPLNQFTFYFDLQYLGGSRVCAVECEENNESGWCTWEG